MQKRNHSCLDDVEIGVEGNVIEVSQTSKKICSNEERLEKEIESAITSLTTTRGCSKSCCPSEIPRLLLKYPNWREYMNLTRKVAFKMAELGTIEILQKGSVINSSQLSCVKGIIRLRLSSKIAGAIKIKW